MATGLTLVWLAVLSGYDIARRRLPNWLTLPGAAVILAVAVSGGHGVAALTGAVALAGLYLLVRLVVPAGIGGGDVKLAAGLGALTGCFGAAVWFLAALTAPLLTAGWALARRAPSAPHGPAMCLASALAVGLAPG